MSQLSSAADVNGGQFPGAPPFVMPTAGAYDFVTVVTAKNGERLTKLIYKDGEEGLKTLAYDRAREFLYEQRWFLSLDELVVIIRGLNYTQAIIPGWLVDGLDPKLPHRRLSRVQNDGTQPTLRDVEHSWFPVDADGLTAFDGAEYDPFVEPERAARQVRRMLPSEFHEAECLWQQSASAAIKRDANGKRTINMKLFFRLSRPLDTARMKLWMDPYLKERDDKKYKTHGDNGVFDGAMYQRDRLIYVAETRVTIEALPECQITEEQWMGILPGAAVQVPPIDAERLVVKGNKRVMEKVFFERKLVKKDQQPVALEKIDAELANVKSTRPREQWYQILSAMRNTLVDGLDANQSYHVMWERTAKWMTNQLYTGKNPITAEELEHLKGPHREDWETVFEHGAMTNYGFGTIVHYANVDNPDRNQAVIELPGGAVGDTITTEYGSDDYVAAVFARDYYANLRYVEQWGWTVFGGQRWERVPDHVIWNLVRPIVRQIALSEIEAESTRRSMLGAAHIAGSERLARGAMAARPDMFDADPFLLNTPSGVVDLRTSKRHDADPRFLCTKMTAVAPRGACPTWIKFLDQVTAGDEQLQRYLQKTMGAALIGTTREHLLLYLYGEGGNGKGTFLNALKWVMGDYAVVLPAEMFMESRNQRHPTELTPLKGARLAIAQEVKEGTWDETKIKMLTGGDDITAHYMRQDPFTFSPSHTLVMSGNHLPSLRHVDAANRRRLRIVPFKVKFDRADVELPEKLKAEGGGILQWLIDGCVAYLNQGLEPPDVVKAETDAYFRDQDRLQHWIDEQCDTGRQHKTRGSALFASYRSFAEDAKEGFMRQSNSMPSLRSGVSPERRLTATQCLTGSH